MKRADPAGLVVAAILLALAAVVGRDLLSLELTSTYGLGPKAIPGVIAAGLAALGVTHLAIAVRHGRVEREPADPRPVLLIGGGLAVLTLSIALGGGFVLGTAVLFAATARAFGRRALAPDLAIGFALAFVAYLLFAKLLTLSLPAGPLERLI